MSQNGIKILTNDVPITIFLLSNCVLIIKRINKVLKKVKGVLNVFNGVVTCQE